MKCLDTYRQNLVRSLNNNLEVVINSPEEEAVHDFRVGVKRLTAFYYFLGSLNPNVKAKKILKPYRGLFKSIGKVRDLHVAENLIIELDKPKQDLRKLKSSERSFYRSFKNLQVESKISRIRVPTVRSTGITEAMILAGKEGYLERLLSKFRILPGRMTNDAWHKKRILLKRYHHTLDAFQYCHGHEASEERLKQIRMIEQLLGDWHDRVTTVELVKILSFEDKVEICKELQNQERNLLNAAKIYHRKYTHLR